MFSQEGAQSLLEISRSDGICRLSGGCVGHDTFRATHPEENSRDVVLETAVLVSRALETDFSRSWS